MIMPQQKFLNIKKMPLDEIDSGPKDLDFFLSVLEMFRSWLISARDKLAEKKDENEQLLSELEKSLGL